MSETKEKTLTGRVRLVPIYPVADDRGRLTPFDYRDLPFIPQRIFVIDNVPAGETRGGHGHKSCRQLLICLRGTIEVICEEGPEQKSFLLEPLSLGLLIEEGVISTQRYLTDDAVLLAFASEPYDPGGYITRNR